MPTVNDLLRSGIERLRESGSESPRLDVELLLAKAIGVDRTALIAHPEAPVGPDAASGFEADLDRRVRGEPVAYIRGFKEFRGLIFGTDRRALIPRPETERVVDVAEAEIVSRLTSAPRPAGTPPLRVADVGTGCGTIAVSLAVALRKRRMLDEVRLVATDLDGGALQLARENAVGHGVADRIEFILADVLPPDGVLFDVIAANLPYVPSGEVDDLPIAASFEPRQALDGGPDGLHVIRDLLGRLASVLRPDGAAVLEIGSDHEAAITDSARARLPGWTCDVIPDLAGLPRVARIEPPARVSQRSERTLE